MTLHMTQFSAASCHFFPRRSNILLSTLFSNTLTISSSRNLTVVVAAENCLPLFG
jgi:hypothetical protein